MLTSDLEETVDQTKPHMSNYVVLLLHCNSNFAKDSEPVTYTTNQLCMNMIICTYVCFYCSKMFIWLKEKQWNVVELNKTHLEKPSGNYY